MPKIVDAEERRSAIADAVLAVIARGGIRAATLSSIASESGLAVGSVRHYFAGHAELLTCAAEALVDRTTARLETHLASLGTVASPDARRTAAVDMLCELLPLDDVRAIEAAVWLEFAIAARTNSELAYPLSMLHDGLRTLVARIIDAAAVAERLRDEVDIAVEVARLHALVDGLLLHGVLSTDPEFGALSRRVLDEHLAAISR